MAYKQNNHLKKKIEIKKFSKNNMFCAACNAKLEFDILDLGKAPITNNLLSKFQKKFKVSYSLKVSICNKCWLTQNET